jgi:hypothetical protein
MKANQSLALKKNNIGESKNAFSSKNSRKSQSKQQATDSSASRSLRKGQSEQKETTRSFASKDSKKNQPKQQVTDSPASKRESERLRKHDSITDFRVVIYRASKRESMK